MTRRAVSKEVSRVYQEHTLSRARMTAVWGAEDTSYESKKLAPIENGLKKLLDLLPGFTFIMCNGI